jgi:hypothetical protein
MINTKENGVSKLWIFILFFVMGCQTKSQDDVVLIRSLDTTPAWVFQSSLGSESLQDKEYVYFVFKKDHVSHLALGIKQAQTSAIKQLPNFLKERLRDEFINSVKYPGDKSLFISLLDPLLNDTMTKAKISSRIPTAVYWERRQSNEVRSDRTYYVVWVLLSVQKTEYKGLVKQIAKGLLSLDNKEANLVGNDMLRHYFPEKE